MRFLPDLLDQNIDIDLAGLLLSNRFDHLSDNQRGAVLPSGLVIFGHLLPVELTMPVRWASLCGAYVVWSGPSCGPA